MTTGAPLRRRGLLRCGAGLWVAGLVLPARAGPPRDHDRARAALEHGEALPLADILTRVRPELGGEVVGVSFERDGGRWVYEFKVVGPGGRLNKVHVDAATARVLRRKAE